MANIVNLLNIYLIYRVYVEKKDLSDRFSIKNLMFRNGRFAVSCLAQSD